MHDTRLVIFKGNHKYCICNYNISFYSWSDRQLFKSVLCYSALEIVRIIIITTTTTTIIMSTFICRQNNSKNNRTQSLNAGKTSARMYHLFYPVKHPPH